MARQVMPWVGAAIGFVVSGGNPMGAQLGFAAGSIIGNVIDPQKLNGPKLGEGQAQTAQEGAYRPIVFGTGQVGGNVIYRGPRIVRTHTESGKGGPEVRTERGYRTFGIRICEGQIGALLRIWENGKLVYDVRPESEIPAESVEYAKRFRLYLGGESQLPDPALEAYLGVGNVCAHNGTAYIVFENYDLTDLQDMVPTFLFEVGTLTTTYVVGDSITATYTMAGDYRSSYIFPLANGNLGFVTAGNAVAVGETYTRGELNSALSVVGSTSIEWDGFDYGDSRLSLRGINEAGLGISADDSFGYCNLFQGGDGLGYFLPTDADAYSWWYAETFWAPEYGGLVWFGDATAGAGSWYLGVRKTGSSGQYENRLLKFPLSGGPAVAQAELVTGVGTVTNPRFWMTRSRDGHIHVIEQGGDYRRFDADLQEVVNRPLGISISDLRGFGVDGDVLVLVYGTFFGGQVRFYRLSDATLMKAIASSDVEGDVVTRVVFTDDSCYIQCRTWVGRIAYSASVTSDKVPLYSVISALHERVGAVQYDVSELADLVDGVVFADGYSARDAITTTLVPYHTDIGEFDRGSGYKINYVKQGRPSDWTITIDDLVEEPEETVREDALERPRALHFHYQSPTIGYAPAKATIARLSPDVADHLVNEVSIATPITFKDQDEAWQRADVLMRKAWTEVAGKRQLPVSDALLGITPTDILTVPLRGKVTREKVLKTELSEGVLKLEVIADRQSNVTSNLTGPALPPPEPPPPSIAGPTYIAIIDEAGLVDSDDRLGYYVAACGISEGWGGAAVQRSLDGGTSYSTVATFNRSTRSVMGTLVDPITAASPHYTDTTNTVSVQLYWEGDEIESLTEQQFLSEGGAFALEWDDGGQIRWEILQYRDAEQDDTDPQVWHLSHLARGRLNTSPVAHASGVRFVLLNRYQFVVAQSPMIGQAMTHRGVSLNTSPETATPETVTYAGRSQREWEVAHVLGEIDGDDLNLTIVPRHRFGTELHPIRSINWDGYRITATDGSNSESVDTTIAAHTFDVSGWGSPITVTVAQLNRITGAGPTVTEQF